MNIDVIGTNYSDIDEPESVYYHVPFREIVDTTGKVKLITTLCGYIIWKDKVLWYSDTDPNCPTCLKTIALCKSIRISKSKLLKADWT